MFHSVPEVVEANVGGKAFLLHVSDWVYLEMNESGTRIWNLLQDGKSPGDIATELVREFEVDPDVCSAETDEFLAFLESRRFVTRSPAA